MRFALSLIVFSLAVSVAGAALTAPKRQDPKLQDPKLQDPKECPRPFSDREGIASDLASAKTCDASVELFAACQTGASGDIPFGDAVVERCERDFLAGMSPQKKRAYRAAHDRCDRQYAKEPGTMYRSFEAFCHAQVAQSYARRAASPR